VQPGIVVGCDRRGDASLRGVAVRVAMRGFCEHEDRGAGLGRGEGGREAGDAGTDHENVVPLAF
jgi:hypothetical protein